jgi:hypothetical protein
MQLRAALLAFALFFGLQACSAPPPEPLVVLENPTTGARVHFYREVPFKVPAGYDEKKHIAQWKADEAAKGFTKIVKE